MYYIPYTQLICAVCRVLLDCVMQIIQAVCSSAVKAAIDMGSVLIVLVTDHVDMITAVAKYRPHCAIVVVTKLQRVANQVLFIHFGIAIVSANGC